MDSKIQSHKQKTTMQDIWEKSLVNLQKYRRKTPLPSNRPRLIDLSFDEFYQGISGQSSSQEKVDSFQNAFDGKAAREERKKIIKNIVETVNFYVYPSDDLRDCRLRQLFSFNKNFIISKNALALTVAYFDICTQMLETVDGPKQTFEFYENAIVSMFAKSCDSADEKSFFFTNAPLFTHYYTQQSDDIWDILDGQIKAAIKTRQEKPVSHRASFSKKRKSSFAQSAQQEQQENQEQLEQEQLEQEQLEQEEKHQDVPSSTQNSASSIHSSDHLQNTLVRSHLEDSNDQCASISCNSVSQDTSNRPTGHVENTSTLAPIVKIQPKASNHLDRTTGVLQSSSNRPDGQPIFFIPDCATDASDSVVIRAFFKSILFEANLTHLDFKSSILKIDQVCLVLQNMYSDRQTTSHLEFELVSDNETVCELLVTLHLSFQKDIELDPINEKKVLRFVPLKTSADLKADSKKQKIDTELSICRENMHTMTLRISRLESTSHELAVRNVQLETENAGLKLQLDNVQAQYRSLERKNKLSLSAVEQAFRLLSQAGTSILEAIEGSGDDNTSSVHDV